MSYKENARVKSIDNNEGIDSCIDKYIKEKTDNFIKTFDEKMAEHTNKLLIEIKRIAPLHEDKSMFINLTDYIESQGLKDVWESYLKEIIVSGIKSELKKRKEVKNCLG